MTTEDSAEDKPSWYPGSPFPPDDDVPGLATPLPFLLTDHARSLVTFGWMIAATPWLRSAPRGDGQPVLILPGLGAGDISTLPMRRYLARLGYDVTGWGFGVNVGPTRKVLDGLFPLVERLAQEAGEPITIIGWSLGGIFARIAARMYPESVRQVITMGSPFALEHPRQTRALRLYQRLTPFHAPLEHFPESPAATRDPLPVPSTAIYSPLDGIVDWRSCIEPAGDTRENIAVWSSHLGYGHDPSVMWAVADRLAQPPGEWTPFKPPGWAAALYPLSLIAV